MGFGDAVLSKVLGNSYHEFKQMKWRNAFHQVMQLGMIVGSALAIWHFLMVVTKSESPVVVVLSGSMEPAFHRGDILFLDHNKKSIEVGDIVVFNIDKRSIPIVHRVIRAHEASSSPTHDPSINLLTKGDNNWVDDIGLYAPGQKWLNREHIMGRIVGFLPYLGMVTIIMNDYPWVKYLLIAGLGLMVVTTKE